MENEKEAVKEGTKQLKEAADKAKNGGKKVLTIFKFLEKNPWALYILIIAVVIIILYIAFIWILDLLDADNINTSISAATSLVGTISEQTEEGDTSNIQTIQTTIKEINGEYKYIFEFDITDEEKEKVNNILAAKGIELTEENKNFITALVKNGYKIEDNLTKEILESLLLFYKAQIASESLDLRSREQMFNDGKYISSEISLETEGVQGIVRLERVNVTEKANTQREFITYKPREDYDKLKNASNADIKKYFTITNGGNCLLATWQETKVIYEYPAGYPLEKEANVNKITINNLNGDIGVPYKDYIAKYSMPYELLTCLQIYLKDTKFCTNLAKSVKDSSIIISLHETSTTQTSVYTEEYKIKEVKYYDYFYTNSTINTEELVNSGIFNSISEIRRYITEHDYGLPEDIVIAEGYNAWTYKGEKYNLRIQKTGLKYHANLKRTTQVETTGSETPIILENDKSYTALEENGTYNVKTTRININNTNKLDITQLDTWYLNYEKILSEEGDKSDRDTGVQNCSPTTETEIDPEAIYNEYPKTELSQEDINKDTYIKQYKDGKGYGIIWSNESCNVYTNKIIDKIPKTYRNMSVKREEKVPQIISEVKSQEVENSFLYFLNISTFAKDNIKSSTRDWLFETMQRYEKTENLIDVIKYLLYVYTGYDYGVTELEINVEDIGDFNFIDCSNINLEKYLRQFSHGTTEANAPKSADGKYYLMYGDLGNNPGGHPTIGNSDIQWVSHYDKFNQGGMVIKDGAESYVDNVAEYVKAKLGSHNYTGTDADIRAKEIYIEVGLVDAVGEQIRNAIIGYVDREIAGLTLSKQQKYALIEMAYGRGQAHIKGFKNTYESAVGEGYEIDSWQFNKYIWDNWWYSKSIGPDSAAGKIKGQDAMYETYVKGTFDFKNPYQPNWMPNEQGTSVFDRNYFLFYTNSQRSTLNNVKNMPTARGDGTDASKEEEIFTYIEGSSGFLEVAEEVWRNVCSNFGSYGTLGAIPPTHTNQIDCSGYVSWVLYEYGYTDISSQMSSYVFYNTNWTEKYGWEEIPFGEGANITDMIQPGDIVVRRNNSEGHVAIVVEPVSGGALSYDCGSPTNWINNGGNPVLKELFYTGEYSAECPQLSAEGKIIRVTQP